MLFLFNKENDVEFLYNMTLRKIFLKHDLSMCSPENIILPKIDLFFVFSNVEEIDILKIANHLVLLWLICGNKSRVLKLANRLHRGTRYYRFVVKNSVKSKKFIYKFFDFFLNTFLYLLERIDLKLYNNLGNYFFEVNNLDIFSNIRLSRSFYTAKVNDKLFLKFYFPSKNKQFLNLNYVLKTLKFL